MTAVGLGEMRVIFEIMWRVVEGVKDVWFICTVLADRISIFFMCST
jgi:hypothetical protein